VGLVTRCSTNTALTLRLQAFFTTCRKKCGHHIYRSVCLWLSTGDNIFSWIFMKLGMRRLQKFYRTSTIFVKILFRGGRTLSMAYRNFYP